jgi:hypothetical protein
MPFVVRYALSKFLLATAVLSLIGLSACRNDDGAEEELKWSCARVQTAAPAIATPECLQVLERSKSKVLKFYKPVPKTVAGKVVGYKLVERREALR